MSDQKSLANVYLRKWTHEYTGYQELPTAASHLQEVLKIFEEEFAKSEIQREKQALLAVAVGATKFFLGTQFNKSDALVKLHEALVALTRGETGENVLTPAGQRTLRRNASRDFKIACAVVALELYPKKSGAINGWLVRELDMRVHEVRKMKDNLDQKEDGHYAALRRDLEYVRASVKSDDDWMIREIFV